MNYTVITGSVIGIGLLGYLGYKWGYNKVNEYVIDRVMKELDKRMENEEGFKPMRTNSAMIKVSHGGKSHSIYVPYNRRKTTKMLRTKVFLLKGEEKIDITQKPGIPYLVSAKDLGGEMIIVEDKGGNVLYTFKDEEIPDCY